MKEIKVATLTKEEVKEYKELEKMRERLETLMAQGISASHAFWKKLSSEHGLMSGNHYILGNSIYKQEIDRQVK